MSPLSLPPELWPSIEDDLDVFGLRMLSLNCRALLHLTQRRAYREVMMTENGQSGRSIRAVMSGPTRLDPGLSLFAPSHTRPTTLTQSSCGKS